MCWEWKINHAEECDSLSVSQMCLIRPTHGAQDAASARSSRITEWSHTKDHRATNRKEINADDIM